MTTPLLVVTPSPAFGELIRRSLEDTGDYRVFIVSNKATAIVRADEESCRLAFLDLDLGEQWVEEVGQSLRTVIPSMKLFILAQDETPPAFDSIRPWTLIRKPFQLPELLKTISRPTTGPFSSSSAETSALDLAWLSDVNKAAQHLTRLTLESSSQAALITRNNQVWAYAGQLSQEAAQEVAATMAQGADSELDGDLLRFARFESTKAEHILYATRLAPGMLLGFVFDAETPFNTIRSQAAQLGASLADNDAGEAPSGPLQWPRSANAETPAAPPSEALDTDDEDLPLPPISDILQDIPTPDPRFATDSLRADGASSTEMPSPVDPALTRRSIFAREYSTPTSAVDRTKNPPETAAPSLEGIDRMPAAKPVARPETPVRKPLPGEMDATRPHSMAGFSPVEADHIVLEPASAGMYHLNYACLVVPRFTAHFLTGDVADKLSEWMPIICVAFGWRLEYLAVRPEYLQWVVNVPPATSPGYVMRVMRQQLSDKIFTAFPRLKKDNPSGDFWAPGYLIMGGTQAHPSQLVKDYIKQVRQRQGIEKPKK